MQTIETWKTGVSEYLEKQLRTYFDVLELLEHEPRPPVIGK